MPKEIIIFAEDYNILGSYWSTFLNTSELLFKTYLNIHNPISLWHKVILQEEGFVIKLDFI
jgi:hypothetical protein